MTSDAERSPSLRRAPGACVGHHRHDGSEAAGGDTRPRRIEALRSVILAATEARQDMVLAERQRLSATRLLEPAAVCRLRPRPRSCCHENSPELCPDPLQRWRRDNEQAGLPQTDGTVEAKAFRTVNALPSLMDGASIKM